MSVYFLYSRLAPSKIAMRMYKVTHLSYHQFQWLYRRRREIPARSRKPDNVRPAQRKKNAKQRRHMSLKQVFEL